jgi:hypothetical protein
MTEVTMIETLVLITTITTAITIITTGATVTCL